MWKTQHMAFLAIVVTVVSVTLTLFAHSRINQAIATKAQALASPGASPGISIKQPKTNPIQLMSALSSKKIRPDDKSKASVRFEEPQEPQTETPKGAGVRWTPL